MMRTKLIFLLACLFFSASGFPISNSFGKSLIEVGIIPSVPRNMSTLRSFPTSNTANMMLARNEIEMLFLRLKGEGKMTWNINVQGTGAGLSVEFFEVLRVPVDSGGIFGGSDLVFDPMIPLEKGQVPAGNDELRLIVVKVTASTSATPGIHSLKLLVSTEKGTKHSLNLDVNTSKILLPEEMPINVQAAVWPPGKWYLSHFGAPNPQVKAEANILELIRFLRRYRVNALSRLWSGKKNTDMSWRAEDVAAFHRLVNIALDDLGYQLIRLPTPVFFSNRKTFSKVAGFSTSELTRWIVNTERFLGQFSGLLRDPQKKGRFAYEIWDEPGIEYMPQVNALYKAFGDRFPDISLELTRESYAGGGLEDVADIWAVGLTKFKSKYTQDIQKRGDKVWLYANQWHGLDRQVTDTRAIGWALWKYNLNGYLLWGINRWPGDPWTTVSAKKTDHYKRATFVYPHPTTGEIVPSLRLEFFREGLEDMLLLRAVEKQLPKALATELQAVFPQDRPRYKSPLPDFDQYHKMLLQKNGLRN
jgi:hypothetical protein